MLPSCASVAASILCAAVEIYDERVAALHVDFGLETFSLGTE